MDIPHKHYDADFYGWAHEQADLIRHGHLNQLDIDNLIEEIEDMGNRHYDKLESAFGTLLAHLLKWRYQSERTPNKSWQLTIAEQRRRIDKCLERNPSLKGRAEEAMAEGYHYGKIKAAKETPFSVEDFPDTCEWDYAQVTDDNFYPAPGVIGIHKPWKASQKGKR